MSALAVPRVDATALRAAGRAPAVPFRIALADGSEVLVDRLLRVLPGKRIVGAARWQGAKVLAKLFIAAGSARHWQREAEGIGALAGAGIATPALLASSALNGGGHALLTEFIDNASTLAERWAAFTAGARPDEANARAAITVLCPAFRLLGQLHANGLVHDDLHLGNFLASSSEAGEALRLIDGDAVRAPGAGQPLARATAIDNLALLAAQLAPQWDRLSGALVRCWQQADSRLPAVGEAELHARIDHWRSRRLADYLAKSARDCSLFKRVDCGNRHGIVVRGAAAALAGVLADPDAVLAGGELLKDGNTCTVAKASVDERAVVIKRYNIKSFGHALSRAWRPSRAAHAWRAGHRLAFLGIATPAPLAMMEERIGPLRRRAWLVTAWSSGQDLAAYLAPWVDSAPPPACAHALVELFTTLQRFRISHGDLKANNLLWENGRIVLIDLDAMQQHRSARAYARAWRRDRARLLRNWPAQSALRRWLDQHLPPA